MPILSLVLLPPFPDPHQLVVAPTQLFPTLELLLLVIKVVGTWVSELTFLAGSELDLASYKLFEDQFLATCEQELCPLGTLSILFLASELSSLFQRVTSSELQMIPAVRKYINDYYVRFHKLVNDIRNIRMTMPNILLNSKFVNNMSPEWDSVQPYAQVSHVQSHQYPSSSTPLQSPHVQSLQMVGSWFRMFKDDRIRIRESLLGELVQQEMGEHRIELGMPMQDKMMLMQAQENGAVLDEEELLFLDSEQTNTFDADVDNQPVKDLALNEDNMSNMRFITKYKKNVSDSISADMGNSNVIPFEQYLTVNYVSVVPSSASSIPNDAYVLHDNDAYVPYDPLDTELNIYKEQVAMYEQLAKSSKTKGRRAKAKCKHPAVLPPANVYPPNTHQSSGSLEASNYKSTKYWSAQLKDNSKYVTIPVSKPLPLGGDPGHVTMQPDFFFTKRLEYLREECKYDVVLRCKHNITGGFKDNGSTLIDTHLKGLKYLYPSNFEDLYLLNLQGHLNHLSPEDKKILTTAVNLWTRNLVIRQRVKDFQLGIESYQTGAIHLGPNMGLDVMRFNEIHKFSDGTLQQIDEALDYRVKEFRASPICAKSYGISMHILRGAILVMMAIVETPKDRPCNYFIRVISNNTISVEACFEVSGRDTSKTVKLNAYSVDGSNTLSWKPVKEDYINDGSCRWPRSSKGQLQPMLILNFAAALPSSSPPPENVKSLKDNIREMMTTVNQGMSVEEIERVVAQRVANAIEAIAIYKTKTNIARKSMIQTERQEDKVAENASNRRKWEGNHNGILSQQNKGHKVLRAHTTWPINMLDLYLCATSENFTIMGVHCKVRKLQEGWPHNPKL
ncbi:hypothetical protein Tco_0452963 [Tanacetum coccineum]